MKKRNGVLSALMQGQREWADRNKKLCDDDGYCLLAVDNLHQPLTEQSEQELRSGDGGELGTPGKRGKFQALHSSSALACNVFDYWRNRPLTALAKAFGVSGGFTSMALERKFPNGVSGSRAPNLDVAFQQQDGGLLAIESKFTEPYRASNKNRLRHAYFATPVWRTAGLPGCQTLAETIQEAPTFRLLDAAQLLKHMLGLARSGFPQWQLCYLWFDAGGDDGERHRIEITAFSRMLANDVDHFTAFTYQALYRRLVDLCGPEDAAYLSYIGDRYFDKTRTPT